MTRIKERRTAPLHPKDCGDVTRQQETEEV